MLPLVARSPAEVEPCSGCPLSPDSLFILEMNPGRSDRRAMPLRYDGAAVNFAETDPEAAQIRTITFLLKLGHVQLQRRGIYETPDWLNRTYRASLMKNKSFMASGWLGRTPSHSCWRTFSHRLPSFLLNR